MTRDNRRLCGRLARLLTAALAVCCALPGTAAAVAPPAAWNPGISAIPPADAVSILGDSSLSSVSCAADGECSAVGRYLDAAQTHQGLLVTETAGGWQTGTEATLPAGAATDPSVQLVAVSCASTGNCSAVGTYSDSAGNKQGLLLTESSGTWGTAIKAALPAGAGANPQVLLQSLSCSTAGNCAAAGTYSDSAGNKQGLLLTESTGVWATGVKAALPANAAAAPNVALTSISCASAGNCAAVGSYNDSSGATRGLLLSETSGVWATGTSAALPAGAGTNPKVTLGSVSCASAGNCAAVGSYDDGAGATLGLLLSATSGVWATGTKPALPADAATNPTVTLSSVSCPSAANCTAVGSYGDTSTRTQGLLLNQTSGVWATGEEASVQPAATDLKVTLSSVSCASPRTCTAVGSYDENAAGTHGLYVSETSGAWTAGGTTLAPAGAATTGTVLRSVSCASAGTCGVAGSYHTAALPGQSVERGLLDDQHSGGWGTAIASAPVANAARIATVTLISVSCAAPGSCTAVGTYVDPAGTQGLLVSESSGAWGTGIKPVLPGGAAADPQVALGLVSCASAGNCAAVGTYPDGSSHTQGLLLSESSGVWATGVKVTLPAGAATDPQVLLGAVSCGAPGDCAAAGTYLDSAGHKQGVLLSASAGVWAPGVQAALPADAAADPKVRLTSVSCAAAGSCAAVGSYTNGAGDGVGLLLSEVSGAWTPGVKPTLPAGAAASGVSLLASVSCAPAGGCTAVGSYLNEVRVAVPGLAVSGTPGAWGTGVETPVPANASR